ncbi:enhanced serine sensitivity protein SseB C-terminal domain-containing protein [Hymenobacter endophyticus]|uniref:Enhanced serine sensitivity protein SseB C-terminal domain-containing protein n=1 Tax=Hymenobacter endophyticus TaxID=3076335 RepID=A0ABU3TNL1_9BACT|nr:enhanced serine sensitivity protein SseB C-terminal domain-containing protein [Hymenobacter endophyticus]MDU0372780.1 enhanced serine sensitivity protein SseB C-terminal domain-containing protein [Hymenobacter endophyticus]
MGLFDFLKKKDEGTPAPASTPTPGATPSPEAPASDSGKPAGPRYKGSNYQMPATPAPAATPFIPPAPPIPLPGVGEPMAPQMPDFQPLNILEQLLMQAAVEPQFRTPFYQALLGEEVTVVMAAQEGLEPGEVTPTEGMEIQLQALHDGKIAVFTAPERIHDNGAVPEGSVTFLRLRGHDFFTMVKGADCALNPFSAVGKLLEAAEIDALLAGQLFEAPPQQDMQVSLHDPEPEPLALKEALREYSAGRPQVEAVFLTEMRMQHNPQESRLLLAFQTEDQDPAFLQDLGPIIQGNIGEAQFVDLMLIDPNSEEPLIQYLLNSEPVYKRA